MTAQTIQERSDKQRQISVALPDDVRTALYTAAKEDERSPAQLARLLIVRGLQSFSNRKTTMP